MPAKLLTTLALVGFGILASTRGPVCADTPRERDDAWAFTAPRQPALPSVKTSAPASNPIDRFILARLEAQGLSLNPRADKLTLLRRVTFDLTGLPPTIAEQEAFLADHSPDAYAKVV